MTSQEIFAGAGLTIVLAVGSQVLAARLRLPAIIILLPVGFTVGAFVEQIRPSNLIGAAFGPLVSLAVAVILYDAGLELDLRRLTGQLRKTVVRLVGVGTLVTWVAAALAAAPLLDMSGDAAAMLGAILVVSGPTVVGPLLAFVRPTQRMRQVLTWEGSLIDVVGGLLGALVFHTLSGHAHAGFGHAVGSLLLSAAVGLGGGLVGIGVLWLLLVRLDLGEVLGTTVQLAAVVGIAGACDALRDDAGLVSANLMGVAVASLPGFATAVRRPFFQTLVSLVVGVLFISISASVTPASLRHVVLPSLALVGVLVVLVRPLVARLATLRTDLTRGEWAFLGWMAPRGIVAASTAATFSSELADKGVGGAERILPATFVVIVATVCVYGLTAVPVARRLGVVRPAASRPLLVGDAPWVVELACAVKETGIEPLLWTGDPTQRQRAEGAGLELLPGDLVSAAGEEEAEELGLTSVLLLTANAELNALAATMLGETGLPVFRLQDPPGTTAVTPPQAAGRLLFGPGVLAGTLAAGRSATQPAGAPLPDGSHLLFAVDGAGRLLPATPDGPPPRPDTGWAVLLRPQPAGG